MTPDLQNDPVALLGVALVLGLVALVLWLRERRAPRLVVLLAQRREDGGPDDGVLDQQPEREQQQGDDEAEDEGKLDILRGEHAASVSPRCGACRDLSWTHTYAGDCQVRRG